MLLPAYLSDCVGGGCSCRRRRRRRFFFHAICTTS